MCGPLGSCDSIKAETMVLLMGLRELRNMEAQNCIVEGDSASVVGWAMGKGNGSWCLAYLLHDIGELSTILDLSFSHIPGEKNTMADRLANCGVELESLFIGNDVPDCCL